jgi:hypothetical protein
MAIRFERDGAVGNIVLANPPFNRIDLCFAKELRIAMHQASESDICLRASAAFEIGPRCEGSLVSGARRMNIKTVIEYKGYRIEVSPVGKGWRAAIFASGSTRALADSPSNLEKSRTEDIIAEAKRIINARLGPRSL